MAITSSGSFVTATSKTAGTTFSFPTTTNVPANALAVLFIATDNLSTAVSSSDILSVTDNSVLATNLNFLAGTGFNGAVHTIVTQSDGKIIAGGEFTTYSGSTANRIARLNTNGTLDTTFVQGTGFNNTVYKLLIQNVSGSDNATNDKIVAVGAFTQYSGSTYSGSVRITPSGSVDRSYSVGTGSFNGTVLAVALETTSSYSQSVGGPTYTSKLVMGGTFTTYSGSTVNGIVKLLGNAQRETTSSISPGNGNAGFNTGVGFSGSVDVRDIKILTIAGASVAGWTSSGTVNTARDRVGSAGIKSAGLMTVGNNVSDTSINTTEEYDGSTWTAVNNALVSLYSPASAGTQTAAKIFGGATGANNACNCVQDYDGTNFSTGTAFTTARFDQGGAGSSTDAVIWGGINVSGTNIDTTEEWNGSAWGAGGTFPAAVAGMNGIGTGANPLSAGGANPSWNCTYCYANSTNTWTTLTPANIHFERRQAKGFGTFNCAMSIGGFAFAPSTACVQTWNGTTWSAGCNALTNRAASAAGGYLVTNEGFIAAGRSNVPTNTVISSTENWSDGTGAPGASCLFVAGNFTAYSGSLRNRIAVINTRTGAPIATGSYNIGTGFNAAVNSIFLEPSTNKLLATGNFTSYSGSTATRIARINVSGSIDSGSSFNTGAGLNDTGSVIYAYTSGSTPVILIGGQFTQYSGSNENGLVRILASGSIDTRFADGGFTTNTLVEDVIAHSNGQIVAVGDFTLFSSSITQNRISKINADGTIDATYTPAGTWTKVAERGTGEAAAAGVSLALFYRNTGTDTIPAGTAVTASFNGSITANAATGWAFYYGNTPLTASGATTSSTTLPLNMRITGLDTKEYLFLRGVGQEGPSTNAFTTSSAIGGYTRLTLAGTTGGASATNISVAGEWRIATTSSLASNPT